MSINGNYFTKGFKNPTKYLGVAAVVCVASGSMLMNVKYAVNNYSIDYLTLTIFTAVVISSDVLKTILLGKAISCFEKGKAFWFDGGKKVLVWLAVTLCSVLMALATVSETIMDNPKKDNEISSLEKSIKAMKQIPTPDLAEVYMIQERSKVPANILKSTDNCVDITLPKSREACDGYLNSKIVFVKSKEKFTKIKRLEQIQDSNSTLSPTKSAVLISLLLTSLSISVGPESIDMFRILLIVGSIELISALGFSLVRVPRRKTDVCNKNLQNKHSNNNKLKKLTKQDVKHINKTTADILENALNELENKEKIRS